MVTFERKLVIEFICPNISSYWIDMVTEVTILKSYLKLK